MKTETVKIYCHSCDGNKYVEEKTYPQMQLIRVLCPECDGHGWVKSEKVVVWDEL